LTLINPNRKEVAIVCALRKKFRLAFPDDTVDLRDYKDDIENTINRVAPGRNVIVYKDHFSTDELSQGESVKIGRELSHVPGLENLGKQITTFRLFEGKLYTNENSNMPIKKAVINNKKLKTKSKGGHL
jgi:hypothetical protein